MSEVQAHGDRDSEGRDPEGNALEGNALHQRTQTICLLILTAIGIGAALYFLRPVLVPFVLAMFISMVVTPVMDILHKRFRLPRGLAIVATIGLAVAGLLLLGALVSSSLGELGAQQDQYLGKIAALQGGWTEWISELEGKHEVLKDLDLDGKLQSLLEKVPGMIGGVIGWTVESGLMLLSRGFLVVIFMMFLITGHRGPAQRDPESLSYELRARVKEYLRVKVLVSGLTGLAVYLILKVIGIDMALVFGLAAFFLNFIPNIGSAVAVLLPLPVILMSGSAIETDGVVVREGVSVTGRVLAFGLPALVQFLVGNVLEPKWMGTSLDLNPIVILLSLIFWGMLWGPVGMLLSVPITSILKILLERLSYTRPIARLLADSAQAEPAE